MFQVVELRSNRYPEEVVISDIAIPTPANESSAPSESGDDFFSSWDKPTIKRPSNPPSRTQTPPLGSRTASPFLNATTNGNAQARSKSPLSSKDNEDPSSGSRAIPSSTIRKATASTGPRKANILGAKKGQKLGAKKIGGGETVDFEEAERKAKEEAERIAKLGYDPEAEEAEAKSKMRSASISEKTKIAAPTPVNPARPGTGTGKGHERSQSEMERLGMGVGRLGFGQVGASKPAAAPKKMGFGAVATSRTTEEGELSSQGELMMLTAMQMTMKNMPAINLEPKRVSRAMSFSVVTILIRMPKLKPRIDFKDLKGLHPSQVMLILADLKKRLRMEVTMEIMVTLKAQPKTL